MLEPSGLRATAPAPSNPRDSTDVETSGSIDASSCFVAQLGFGWGKGRRVIKTLIAGEALRRALERHQRWVDRNGGRDDAFVVVDDWPTAPAPAPKYFRGARRQGEKLRMAKATLRSLGR